MSFSYRILCWCYLLIGNIFALQAQQQLIVFYQDTDQLFLESTLPKLRNLATEKGFELLEKTITAGVPAEVTSTPAIVYQNYRGRSIYAARYTQFSSIENFIRTSRVVAQQQSTLCKSNTLSRRSERLTVAAPVKLTGLTGFLPDTYNSQAFNIQAMKAVAEGMSAYQIEAEVCLSKTDRAFYVDIHPYRNAAGQLFLNLELYSQFSCIVPVFRSAEPLQGNYAERATLFRQAGQIFAREIEAQLQQSKQGDALSAIAEDTPKVSWEAINCALPARPQQATTVAELPTSFAKTWQFAGAMDEDIPALQFRFAQPLERYAGEVREISGQLVVDAEGKLNAGQFKVKTESLTMGIPDLDVKVLEKYIKAAKYPESSFVFEKIEQSDPLVFGQSSAVIVDGTFELMRQRRPVRALAQIQPIFSEAGTLQLLVEATFSVNITDGFGIEGPDGPDPARKTLEFNLNFVVE